MKRLSSLLRSAALAAALATAATGAVALIVLDDAAYASGRGGDDDDGPDWDDDHNDNDNSGHGGGGDFDDFDDDNSGHGSGDDDDHGDDNSGSGDDDDFDDDNSGHGSGDDDDQFDDDQVTSGYLDEHAIYSVEYDSHGDEFMPGEIVFVGRARDLASALNLGFQEIRVLHLTSGGIMARLGLPPRTDMTRATALLAEAAPHAIVTPNNIYRSAQVSRSAPGTARGAVRRAVRSRGTLGVIDTGVDAASLPVADSLLSQRAFAGPQPVAREHGSTVAAIAVSRGVRVHVADVFGHSSDGALAASAEGIAAAIDWMIDHRVAVVNISVEGPDNAVIEEMVRRAAERGHIIVAAAGNGGPAARPTFPAAFDGVLAVTAIDETGRPYIRANRGAYIDFAAHGVNVSVDLGGLSERVSGTSFAAPVIAAEAAAQLHAPSPEESARVLTRLRDRAEDLGAPGRDNIFGWGALRD